MVEFSSGSAEEAELFSSEGEALLRSGLKLAHLRMIVALDENSQVSAAAQVMNITQPAASRMIAEMEEILKVRLLERLPRGVRLTPYGKTLVRRARAVLLELRQVGREISDLRTGKGGSVFLGSVTAPAIELAVPAIREARKLYPRLEVNIQIDTSNVLARELLASRHDFIIGRIPDDLNPRLFNSRVIGIEKACLIVRRGHPLLNRKPVGLAEMADYDWVFQPAGSLLRRTVENIFLSRNIPLPERILNTTSLLLTLIMVAQSDAVAPIGTEVAKFIRSEQEGLGASVEILPVEFEINIQPYSLIMASNRVLSPAAETLYNLVLREIR